VSRSAGRGRQRGEGRRDRKERKGKRGIGVALAPRTKFLNWFIDGKLLIEMGSSFRI